MTPEAKTEVSNLIQLLLTQAQNELKLLEAKNQALKLELAHLRRIRFGAKSEALSQPQFSLFEEDWQTDGGDRSGNRATAAAGSAKNQACTRWAPTSAGSPATHPNTAMNRNPANADSAAAI
ncbi:MAG: transposase [Nitrosomonas sp.]|nr:transposase [Nitrosomonas sp.]